MKLLIVLFSIFNMFNYKQDFNYIYVLDTKYLTDIKVEIEEQKETKENVLETFYGTVTAYGPDCYGCIGITASGYNVKNEIYYNDNEYGNIRIIAADKKYPFGTIIKLNDLSIGDEIVIVLDRGSAIGNNKGAQADLLFYNEDDCYDFGRQKNIKFEVLRHGY